jgi:hypothetical protein
MAPAAVITGQPGIGENLLHSHLTYHQTFYTGKSVWLYYALCRCLSERRPVIRYYCKKPYMFAEEGVYDMGKHFHFLQARFESDVWTLVDSDESQNGIPMEFIGHDKQFFVIYTTPPVEERWSRLQKTAAETIVVMNPWTRSEIYQA